MSSAQSHTEQVATMLDSRSRIHKTIKEEGGGGRREDKQPKERMWHCYTP